MIKYFHCILLFLCCLSPVSHAQHVAKENAETTLSNSQALASSISTQVDKKKDLQYFKHEKTNFLPHQSVYTYVQKSYLNGQKELLVDYLSYKILLQKKISDNQMDILLSNLRKNKGNINFFLFTNIICDDLDGFLQLSDVILEHKKQTVSFLKEHDCVVFYKRLTVLSWENKD